MLPVVVAFLFRLPSTGQPVSNTSLWRDLASLDTNHTLNPVARLQMLYDWKAKADAGRLPQDSVYAKLLHKLGAFEFNVLDHYNVALGFTFQALRINASGKANASPAAASTDLYNITYFYDRLSLHKKALLYYD